MTLTIGNKYEILQLIGEGTFGRVFKGKNIRSSEEIAIATPVNAITNPAVLRALSLSFGIK